MTTQAEIAVETAVEEKPRRALSEGEMLSLLRQKYAAPEYAFLSHVRNSTGYARTTRTADALAFGLWKSRGHYLTGFEIKSSRSDWVRELKDPEKADEIASYCEMWIVVTGAPNIVRAGELPPKWGHITVDAKGALRTEKAPIFDAENVKPMSRGFLAAILRVAQEGSASATEIAAAVQVALDEQHQRQVKIDADNLKRETREYDDLKRVVDEFQRASGVTIDRWGNGASIGRAVRQILHQRDIGAGAWESLANQADQITELIRERASVFAALDPPATKEVT